MYLYLFLHSIFNQIKYIVTHIELTIRTLSCATDVQNLVRRLECLHSLAHKHAVLRKKIFNHMRPFGEKSCRWGRSYIVIGGVFIYIGYSFFGQQISFQIDHFGDLTDLQQFIIFIPSRRKIEFLQKKYIFNQFLYTMIQNSVDLHKL